MKTKLFWGMLAFSLSIMSIMAFDASLTPTEMKDNLKVFQEKNMMEVKINDISNFVEINEIRDIANEANDTVPEAQKPQRTVEEMNDSNYIYEIPDEMAEFPGDVYAWLSKNVKYPKECQKDSISGRVLIQFIINKQGKIEEEKILRSPDKRLSEEAIRVVTSMPNWKPARVKGKPVRMRYVLPIMFRLNKKT